MSDELKPCPLCEGDAVRIEYEVDSKGLGWNPYCYVKIGCDDCNLFINDTFRNESITIDKWNRRPDSTMHKIQK